MLPEFLVWCCLLLLFGIVLNRYDCDSLLRTLYKKLIWIKQYMNRTRYELLVSETFIMAWLDSACIKMVCGETWLQHYLHYLSFDECKQIIIAGVQATVTTDTGIWNPFTLSKEAMKKAKTQIDFQEDKINIFGIKI